MKNLIFIILFSLSFNSFAQQSPGNDTSRYVWYKYQYGQRMPRAQYDSVLVGPHDTAYSKSGFATKGNTLYIGNGSYWTAVQGSVGSGGIDSFAYRRDLTSIDSNGNLLLGALNGKDTFIIVGGSGTSRSGVDSMYVTPDSLYQVFVYSTGRKDSVIYIGSGSGSIDTTNKWVQSATLNPSGDSLIVVKNGVRVASKLPSGGAGSIEYITQGYGTKVDSIGRVYTIRGDSTVMASKSYADALAALKLNSSDTSNFINKTSNQTITGQKKFLDTLVLVSKPIRLESVDVQPVSLFDARVTGVTYPWLSINGNAYGSKIIMGANNSGSSADIFSILASYDVTLQSGTYRDLIVDAAEQLRLRGRRSNAADTAISFVTGINIYNYVGYFNTAGKLTLPKYAAGAVTGTPAYMAAFASNGDLISTALPVGGTTINFVDNEEPAAGTGTSITMANTPTAGSLRVYKNGVKLRLSQFSFTGTTLTLTTSRLITDEFSFQYRY